MENNVLFERLSQAAIPMLTAGGYLLASLKYPEWGLVASLCASPSGSHRDTRHTGQPGRADCLSIPSS